MPYLLGASGPVTTQTTPSRASAREASIFLISACGYGECRILPISIPDRDRSSVYLPWPVVLPAESISVTGLAMMEKSDIVLCLAIPGKFRRNRRFNGLIHLGVSCTAAEIPAQRTADVFFTWLGILIEQRLHRDHESRSAVATLCAAPITISLLNCSKRSMFRDAFYRGDLGSAILVCRGAHGEHGATQCRHAVHKDGAGSAGRIIASALGAGELQLLAQDIEQQSVRLRRQFIAAALHAK